MQPNHVVFDRKVDFFPSNKSLPLLLLCKGNFRDILFNIFIPLLSSVKASVKLKKKKDQRGNETTKKHF
jgi:hypothetical protein